MDNSILSRIRRANDRLRSSVQVVRDALAGRRQFAVDDMQAISVTLLEMAPLAADAKRLRGIQPDVDGAFDAYAQSLRATKTALDQMQFMILAQRAQIQSSLGHLKTVGRWADTLRQTR